MAKTLEDLSSASAERNVIACLIKSEEAWLAVSDQLSSEDFYHPLNRSLYLAIDSLYGKGAKVDPVVVIDLLPSEQKKEIETLGGWEYLGVLGELPLDPHNVTYEAKKIIDLSLRRRVVKAGENIEEIALELGQVDNLEEATELALLDAFEDSGTEVVKLGQDALKFAEERAMQPAEIPGLKTGFERLDKHLQGLQPGRLYVVAARLKAGKSVTLLNWASNIVFEQNVPVLLISTEHSHDEERSRLLALISGVYEHQIRNGTYSQFPEAAEKVEIAAQQIEEAPFYFCAMPEFSLAKIKSVVKKYKRLHGIGAVFFDYIKSSGDTLTKEYQELGILTMGLKNLAAAEGIPIITACQLNREAAWALKQGESAGIETIGGSDRIAMYANTVLMLRQPSKSEAQKLASYNEPRILKLEINRGGYASYHAVLDFNAPVLRMVETSQDAKENE